jgi:hypothetical protein
MFQKLTDFELWSLAGAIAAAKEDIYAAKWPVGTKGTYTRMAWDMDTLMTEISGEQASRSWKDR